MAELNKIELKNKINNLIKNNSNGEITGNVLNGILTDLVDSLGVNLNDKKIPLLIGFGQSNATVNRGETLPTNDRSYIEAASKLVIVPNPITVTNSNSGGAWNSPTESVTMLQQRWKSAGPNLGWQMGVDSFLDFTDFKKVLFVEASSGGQPVSYFHPGGGVRITATGAGWTNLRNKLQLAYDWAAFYGFEIVPFGVFTWQGESDGASRGINQTEANLWMEDWVEIHDALKSLMNITRLPHNFMQIFSTDSATMTLRNRLNLAMYNKALSDEEYNYIELLTADDIANQDPNNLTQDIEHWGYRGYFKAGIQASTFFKEKYNELESINMAPVPYAKPNFASYSPKAVVEAVGGTYSVTGTLGVTVNNTVTYGAGDINTDGETIIFPNPESALITDFTPVFANGLSWAMRFRITTVTARNNLISGSGTGGLFCLTASAGAPQTVRTGSNPDKSFGLNVQDGLWRTLGCTITLSGNVQLFVDGVKVLDTPIASETLGAFSIFTYITAPSLGAIGEMSWCLFKDSPISESDMVTLTS